VEAVRSAVTGMAMSAALLSRPGSRARTQQHQYPPGASPIAVPPLAHQRGAWRHGSALDASAYAVAPPPAGTPLAPPLEAPRVQAPPNAFGQPPPGFAYSAHGPLPTGVPHGPHVPLRPLSMASAAGDYSPNAALVVARAHTSPPPQRPPPPPAFSLGRKIKGSSPSGGAAEPT
jgi:hypothetical protein